MKLDLSSLRSGYASGAFTPTDVVRDIYSRLREGPVWISVVPEDEALARAAALDNAEHALPLWGVPFAVKDNMDVAGMPTTAACPDFAYIPDESATVVTRLLDAGAILIGKTNLDQFATGLVGTRTPYGACASVFNDQYISGGSSSGSAVSVAKELVTFALGTDTAGSGRVPAAFNSVVGMKPSRGLISTCGVVPACRTLDCVSIFAASCADAQRVFAVARGFDSADPFSRPAGESPLWPGASFRFGVPPASQMEFFGDSAAATLFDAAVQRLAAIGGQRVEIDFAPFRDAASLLYAGPWVAERLAAIEHFFRAHADSMDPTVRQIISGGDRYSAIDAHRATYQLAALKRQTEAEWKDIDVLLLPTTGTTYTHAQLTADPIQLNTNLGFYTNFVNLLDLAAVAVPAGFRPNGLPFGVSLIAPAFSDDDLLVLGDRFLGQTGTRPSTSFIEVAVVGAHLTGQPLNHQLTSRGAKLVKACKTSREYRLYALTGTVPPKPGLVHEPAFQGPGIELEVWAVPASQFGSFVASIPSPLGIGTCTLDDGSTVNSFICEPYAIGVAKEITDFGGWRAYRASLA